MSNNKNIELFDIYSIPKGALEELSDNKGESEQHTGLFTSLLSDIVDSLFSSKSVKSTTALKFTNSPLVNYTKLSPNYTLNRNHVIDTITIHCVVGQCTVETLGAVFADPSRQASSNYGIGYDGKIGLYVEEKNRSWCSGGKDASGNPIRVNGISGADNDYRAVTIEVASDTTHPYAVTDKAFSALIDLVTDICKRNNIKQLKWKGDKSLVGQIDKQNMTLHRFFANKSCCGDYLVSKHPEIVTEVNKRLNKYFNDNMSDNQMNNSLTKQVIKYNPYTYVIKLPKKDYIVDFALCKEPKETLSQFYNRANPKPEYLINGGFFSMSNGATTFTYKDENKWISDSQYKMGFGVTHQGEMKYCMAQDNTVKDFICGYPYFLHNGEKQKLYYAQDVDGRHPRTAIGYNDDYYFIVIVDGRTAINKGMTFSELADVFISIGAKYAMNLDGGGSTRCLENGNVLNQPTENRAVDNVVCFYKKGAIQDTSDTKQTTIKYYRCQLGAYTNKTNADNLLYKVTSMGFSGFIKKGEDNIYRVQCGAFTNKTNAEQLLVQLKNKGFNDAYILYN